MDRELGRTRLDRGSAAGEFRQALSIFRYLSSRSPSNAKLRGDEALTYLNLGNNSARLSSDKGMLGKHRVECWLSARDAYQKSLDIYQDMKGKGTLNGRDAGKPDELRGEIAKCDAALRRPGAQESRSR